MRLVGLISGGKDSVYNMLQCIAAGHEIVAVANIEPNKKEELDSYMYQSVGHQVVSLIAGALALPIYRQKTKGRAICKSKTYIQTSHDEVEDLLELLIKVKKDIPIDGVSVGAIASDYQRTRVENVCRRLNLKCFAYLWRRNQEELLQEMIDSELDAIIIKIASIGLNPEEHLGMHIRDVKQYLIELNKKFGVNVCGEGGEYETITLDCPLFHRFIDITESENTILSNDAFAPVAFLNIKNASLKEKFWIAEDPVESLQTRLAHIRSIVKNPYSYVQDCVDEVSLTIFPQRPKKVLSGDLPFPFGNEIKADDQQSSSVQEYWKKPILQKPHSSQKVSFSPASVLSVDSTTCNLHYSTGWCCLGNVSGQTLSDAFSYLQKHLERIKYGFEDVIFVNLFVKDMAEFNSMNKIYSDFMPNVLPPARVCVETQLPPETGVIISMVAHKLVSKSQKVIYSTQSQEKEVMHVQSISHWAPANIGPYSQCVKVGGIYYLAGQIPLIPGTMEILNKPILHQCRLSLRHVLRVIEAMNDKLGFSNIIQAICYVISEEIGGDIPSLWSYITNNENATITTVVVSALPKNAQMEWEVLVCSYDNPQVDEEVEIVDEFYLQLKRCVYKDPYTSSIVCNVSNAKKGGKSQKSLKILTHEGVSAILKHCLQFLRSDSKNITSPLCILKLFYKANETAMAAIISDILKSSYDSKVVATGIPIIACQEPHIFLTITGVCH